MPVGDLAPIGHGRSAQRIGPHADPGVADGVQVQHAGQVVDIGAQEVEPARRGVSPVERDALHLGQAALDQLIGAGGDGAGGVAPGRTAGGGIVFDAAVAGRIVRRGDQDPVGLARIGAVVGQDGVGHGRGRGEAVTGVDQHLDAIADQHLQRRAPGGFGQAVGVAPNEQRAVDPLRRAIFGDRLGDGQDVALGKGAVQSRAPVSRGAEHHPLGRVGHVGPAGSIGADQGVEVDQVFR